MNPQLYVYILNFMSQNDALLDQFNQMDKLMAEIQTMGKSYVQKAEEFNKELSESEGE